MAQDEGDAFFGTEVGQPISGEDTLHGDDKIVPVGSDDTQEGRGGGGQILMAQNHAALIENTDVHGADM
jgi:hypothetical protein